MAQWTIAATATSIASALGLPDEPERRRFNKISIKNADGAANALYVSTSSSVAATPTGADVELGAGDSYTFGGVGELVDAGKLYMIGTANAANIAFITLGI